MIRIFKNVKVECFSGNSEISLESQVNEWLENNNVDIIDIKFSSAACVDELNIYDQYSVLIIYKEQN